MKRMISGLLVLVAAALTSLSPTGAQDSEVIVLDPNHPLIQEPSTIRPRSPGDAKASPGEETPEVVPLPAQGVNAREVLAGLWFRYRVLAEHGDTEQAGRQVATALSFMRREGLRASPEIAGALMTEAHRSQSEGDYRRAGDRYTLAARFAPLLPAPHVGMAAVLLRGDRDVPGALRECWEALRASGSDPGSLYDMAGNALLLLFLGALLGSIGGFVLLALKNAPAFYHDLQERSTGRLTEEGARLVGWLVLALPILLQVPWVWSLVLWIVLLAPYFRGTGRLAAVGLLLTLVAIGPVSRLVGWHFGTVADPAARALIQSVRQGPDLQHEEALKQLVRDHPDEALFPFLLASAYRAGGRFDEAMDAYRRAIEIDPRHARAMVNLGNLHALRQEYAVAQGFYRKAAEADPSLALAHYNSHLAHLESFHLEAADQELREARRLDQSLVAELVAEAAAGDGKRSPQDTSYSSREIWTRALHLRVEGRPREGLRAALTAPGTLAGLAGLAAFFVVPGLMLAPRRGAGRRCLRCGRPYCRRCQVATKYPDVCSQCMHLFILRDGLAPGVKSKKMDEVMRYRRRIFIGARLFSLLLPGSGHVLGGRILVGIALLAGWSTAWIGMALRGRLMVGPESVSSAAMTGGLLPILMLALLVWLPGNLLSHEATGD